jgi:16S rRNA (adenine1518-N6/adenine1519-N6)-dimethyltransferase
MFQKEVAQRILKRNKVWNFIGSGSGFYDAEYLFTVDEHVFIPPPKVKSVFYACRKKDYSLHVVKKLFFTVVKPLFSNDANLTK